jgi:hypothetical protein
MGSRSIYIDLYIYISNEKRTYLEETPSGGAFSFCMWRSWMCLMVVGWRRDCFVASTAVLFARGVGIGMLTNCFFLFVISFVML